jgi:hypothetical protein
MALVDARLLRSLELSESKGDKGTKQHSATQKFLIIADAKDPSFGDILNDKSSWLNLGNRPLPQIDDEVVEGGLRFVVNSRELSHFKDNERAVVMSVRYDAKPEGEGLPEPQGIEPTTWERITIQTQSMQEPAEGWPDLADVPDLDGQGGNNAEYGPARNSAGDPIDGLEKDVAMVKMTYTNTQVLSPDFGRLNAYTNTCNSTSFLGGGAYTVRCMGWSGEYDQKNNVWNISVEFLFKPDGWEIRYYDVGFSEIVGGVRKAILDQAGNPVGQPVPLDGDGAQLNIGSEPLVRKLFPYSKAQMSNLFQECRV